MTQEMILFLIVLGVTIFLFVAEWVRVDIVALLVMVALPWLGLVTPKEAVSGLASNAVVSIIAVIILGYGIDHTGVISRITRPVTELAGKNQRRLLSLVSLAVGGISAFMQNIGAAALFLPAVIRISRRLGLPASRLLMPMGFAAILGGTLTMVASGPLILLNDLLKQSQQLPYPLFAVTPIGLALLATGILYFLLFGKAVLPSRSSGRERGDPQQRLTEAWGLPATIHCANIPEGSPLIGRTIEEMQPWVGYHVNVLVLNDGEQRFYAPWRHTRLAAGQQLGLLGEFDDIKRLAAQGLQLCEQRSPLLDELQGGDLGGFAELVVHPHAKMAGKSIREIALRKRFGIEPILLMSGDRPVQHNFSDQPLHPGDTLVIHGLWEQVRIIGSVPDFVLLTPITEQPVQSKAWIAALCFIAAIGLAVTGHPLSISLLTGALAMVLFRVISIDAAYRAVDWRTVFLLAGLIPLGIAMERSGTAAWVAQHATHVLGGAHPIIILITVSLMATFFSLFMSNVAATVLLVPLVAQLGADTGVSPRALGLLVAVCASNSFILPTHQVNALLMSPGGYRNTDYLRAGSGMTFIFLVVAVGFVYAFY